MIMITFMNALASTRSISSIRIMVSLGQTHGLSVAQCLRGTGITQASLDDADSVVSGAQELQVIDNLVTLLPDREGLGIEAGMRYQLTTFGIWAFAIISSPTVRAAIEVGLRFAELSFVLMRFTFREGPGCSEIVMDMENIPSHLRQFVLERHLTVFLLLSREMMGGDVLHPRELHLSVDSLPFKVMPPALQQCRVVLGSDENRIVLDRAQLGRAVPKANPATAEFCVRQCEALLDQRRRQTGFPSDVRSMLVSRVSDMPSLTEAAAMFQLSTRTFRRRLSEHGSGYRELMEEVRQGVAVELLETARLTVESVAERLGYAETASFIHAFTRWTGVTPGQYRQRGRRAGRA